MSSSSAVEAKLLKACNALEPVSNGDPWDYGWGYADYRHAGQPIMNGPEGPVTLTGSGLEAFEDAVKALQRESTVSARWASVEFWSVAGSMLASATASRDRENFIKRAVQSLRTVGPSLTVLLISNVTWSGEPLGQERFVLGTADEAFRETLELVARGRTTPSENRWQTYLAEQVHPRLAEEVAPHPVAFACWTVGQSSLAIEETVRSLDDLLDLCLLLEPDLQGKGVYRRGPTNRPGVRGLTLDRGAVDRGLLDIARLELVSMPLLSSEMFAEQTHVQWFSADPTPLDVVLREPKVRELVLSCFEDDFLSRSIRLSARWFAEAFFSTAKDDAALALGVAMDALLSGKAALPGGAMADRFALLDPDISARKERRRAYQKAYSVRSAVAHGGISSKLAEGDFVGRYLAMVQDTARKTLALRDVFGPASGQALDELFDDLRLGVRTWP